MKNSFILESLKSIYFPFVKLNWKKCNVFKTLISKKLITKNLRNEGFIFSTFKLNDFPKTSPDGSAVPGWMRDWNESVTIPLSLCANKCTCMYNVTESARWCTTQVNLFFRKNKDCWSVTVHMVLFHKGGRISWDWQKFDAMS